MGAEFFSKNFAWWAPNVVASKTDQEDGGEREQKKSKFTPSRGQNKDNTNLLLYLYFDEQGFLRKVFLNAP